jgi:hypothetical protein
MKDDDIKNRLRIILWQTVKWREWENYDRVRRLIWWYQPVIYSVNSRVWDERSFKKDEN